MTPRTVVFIGLGIAVAGPLFVAWITMPPPRQRYTRGTTPSRPPVRAKRQPSSVVPGHVVPERRGKWGENLDVTAGETAPNTIDRVFPS